MASKRKRPSRSSKRRALAPGSAKELNPLALMRLFPILAKHAGAIQTFSGLLPDLELMFDAGRALIDKHTDTLKQLEALTPEMQELVAEALPIIKS